MNTPNEDLELENELRALRPRSVTNGLIQRIEQELARAAQLRVLPSPSYPRPSSFATGGVLMVNRMVGWACAAAFVAGLGYLSVAPPLSLRQLAAAAHAAPAGTPATQENVVLGTQDEGIVTLDDGTTARRYRIQSVDKVTWTLPQNKASVQWSVPREDVQLVPVAYY